MFGDQRRKQFISDKTQKPTPLWAGQRFGKEW